jgi:hypothetical protein
VLGLKAETSAVTIGRAAFASDRAIEKVAAIELETRLGCVDL